MFELGRVRELVWSGGWWGWRMSTGVWGYVFGWQDGKMLERGSGFKTVK